MLDMSVEQNDSCHFVLLDKDESCPTADLSNIGCPNGPAGDTLRCWTRPRSVRPSVTNLLNTLFYKQMNQFCCKLAQAVNGIKACNDQLHGSGGQRSRSQEASWIWRPGRLAEASVLTLLGWVSFLVSLLELGMVQLQSNQIDSFCGLRFHLWSGSIVTRLEST